MKTIGQDCDFDNAMLFGKYVMVMADGKMMGGGLIEGYDEKSIIVGGRLYTRSKSTFVISPPLQCFWESG
jgi:hypothetical protein